MKYNILFFFILSFFSCQKKGNSCDNKYTYKIDYTDCLKNKMEMQLSYIADTLEYVELKTPEDVVVTRIWRVIPVDSFLIIHSNGGIAKFTRDGNFITAISRHGEGPEEYVNALSISFDPIKKEIIIMDNSRKILYYDLSGKFVAQKKMTEFSINACVSDSILWVAGFALNSMKYIAFALNQKGDTIASIPNPYYGVKSQDGGTGLSWSKYLDPFYYYKDNLYLKGKELNDTIFHLAGNKKKAYAVIDMGQYKLPLEYEAWYSYDAFLKNGSDYWGIPSVVEDDRYLYLLSQRYASVDGNNYVHNENNFRYILYDKFQKKGFMIYSKDSHDNKIKDNILGGPNFWPRWTSDDYYINAIEWYDLANEIKKGKYKLNSDFQNQFNKWGYETNALIILAHKKK